MTFMNVDPPTRRYLVGGFNPSEKYYIVNWDDYSQYLENKKCSKPPTSWGLPFEMSLGYVLGEPRSLLHYSTPVCVWSPPPKVVYTLEI